MLLTGFFQFSDRKLAHDSPALFEEVVERIQAFGIEFSTEILARRIATFTDDRDPRDDFGVKLPGALAVVFAQLGAELNKTQVELKRTFFDFGHKLNDPLYLFDCVSDFVRAFTENPWLGLDYQVGMALGTRLNH